MSSFPPNPVDGTIVEIRPGEFYIFNVGTQSWTRIDGYKFGLATSKSSGLMSNEDLKKLNSLILPPPSSSLTGENCDIVFKNGTVSLYSTDESLSIKHDLSVSNPSLGTSEDYAWQIHENTAGYDFKLNLNKLIEEIESRGRLSKIQLSGPDGPKGPIGEKGLDNLDTGPKGVSGSDGSNSPFAGNLLSEDLSIEQLEENKNRAIVSIENEVTDNENYLVITRANIGDPDASPDRVAPKQFESPWILVLDKQEGKITRKIVSNTEDCMLSCKVSVSSIYYLNIDGIIDTLKERYEYKLAELKANKELLVKSWLRVMSVVYNEQKYALCCALENCETRKRNTNDRRWIESQRIQAAAGNMELTISSDNEDKVISPKDEACQIEEETDGQDSDRVIYGKECDEYLVKIKLDARLHNKDPRKAKKYGYLSAKLPAGDYYVEIIDCCANLSSQLPIPIQKPVYSASSLNSGTNSQQNVGTGQFKGPATPISRSARTPNATPTTIQSAFARDKCNVTRTRRIGTKPGDSFGILKFGQAVNCNTEISPAICKEAKLAGVDISRPYSRAGSGPFLNSKFSEQDYFVLGYVGSDCRLIYDSKFTQIQTTNPQLDIKQNLAAQEAIKLVQSYSGDLKTNSTGVVLKFLNTQPWADANRISAIYGEERKIESGIAGTMNFGSLTENERKKAMTGNMQAIADGKVVTGGIRYEIKNPSWRNDDNGYSMANVILGPAGYIPAAGQKFEDCVGEDCADQGVVANSNVGKWTGKVGIMRKVPSINFRLKEDTSGATDITSTDFEQYQDLSQLIEREIYVPSTADMFFDTLEESKSHYLNNNTLFSHAGGTIKIWIADPNPESNKQSYDGGVIIGIKSRKCLDQLSPENDTEVTAAPIPTIYVYRNEISNDNIIGFIKPYILENNTHANNYNNQNGNISLLAGPQLDADTSKIFFVLADDGLAFYHVHNVKDNQLNTSIFSTYIVEKNDGTAVQPILGGPATLIPDQFADIYKASWSINNDAQGVVLSEFSGDDWTLTLDELNFGKISMLLANDGSSVGETFVLAKGAGKLSNQVDEAKNFISCRSLFRSCNVPESLGGKYSLGIINRSRENFRICRILPEWKVPNLFDNSELPSGDNIWIKKPVTYAAEGEPCGASICDVQYQVIANSDGQIVPIDRPEALRNENRGTTQALEYSNVGTGPFVDDLVDGNSLDFLLLVNSTTTIKTKIDKLAKNLKSVLEHFNLRGVNNIRVGVARFGTISNEAAYNISEILTDQPFKRFRPGLLQTPRYLEDYDFGSYGKGKFLPINGIQPNVGENFYTLTGYVYDNTSASPRPINGALVHLKLPSLGNKTIQSAITDENGMYAFKINSKWSYEIKYDQFQNVIPNAEIEVNLYNSTKMNGAWTFDQYSKNSSFRQYLFINGEWQTNHETNIPYTEDGNSIISLIPISQPDKNTAQQFVAAGMIFKDIKVESIDGENKLTFKVAIDDTGADADFNDFESRVYQKINECPKEATSQLNPIISKTYKIAIGFKEQNSNFGYEFGDIQAGPIFSIDQSDSQDIINKINCGSLTVEDTNEQNPDFEILQPFTYNINSAIHALESIQYRSNEITSAGFAAIKRASEEMPWFANAVKMITLISDIESNENQLNVSLKEQEELTSGNNENPVTDVTIPVIVKFEPVADISGFPNNILNPGLTPVEEIVSPNNWEGNDSSTSNLFSYISKEDEAYIKTSELQRSAYGYITRLSTDTNRSSLVLNNYPLEYTTVKFETKIRFANASNDVSSLIIRIFNDLPTSSSEISSMLNGTIGFIKYEGGGSALSRQNNASNLSAWTSERLESIAVVDSVDYLMNQILIGQASSLMVNSDDIPLGSGSPELLDLESGNWQTITAYLVVKTSELLNNPFYAQIAAYGTDSSDTNTSIDGRFEISHVKISFEDEILPTQKDTSVTSQEALDALNNKKIVLNAIVPIERDTIYEFAEIECNSHNYQYAECEYTPLTREKIAIDEAWVITKLSTSSIKFVNGNKPVNQRNGRKRGSDGRYCNGKSCGEFGIATQEDGSTKLWVDHGARAVFGIRYHRLSPQDGSVVQKRSPSSILSTSYGIPNDIKYPLKSSNGQFANSFGTGLVYSTGGVLFDLKDIDNSSNYYSIPEWQEPVNSNSDGVFRLEDSISEITEDEFGFRKWKLYYDTTSISSTSASYLVGKYKNQKIKNVDVISNEYPSSQIPSVEDHTMFSMDGTSENALDDSAPIRFGNASDNPDYLRVITVQRGYKGVLEYQLTPEVYSPVNQYKAEPSVDLIQDSSLAFPDNAKTTVYQPFWRFSLGLNASTNGIYGKNNLINVDVVEQARENGFYIIGGQVLDGSTINRTPFSGLGGNGNAYIYGALVNLFIPSINEKVVCSAVTDIQGRFALKIPIEWLSPSIAQGIGQTSSWSSQVEAQISIPLYSQQTNDEWQLQPFILGDATASRSRASWKRIITINDSRFTKESVNSYITNENIKSITIQSFFTDPRNYVASQGSNGMILNQNLIYASSFIKIEDVKLDKLTNRFTFKIKSDDGGFNTSSKSTREKGDLLFNDSFLTASHPKISCLPSPSLISSSANIPAHVVISKTINIPTIQNNNFTDIGTIIVPEEDNLSLETMKCGAFFQKFAIEKYREFLTKIPKSIISDCSNTIRGGRAVKYIKEQGVPLTQEVYNGTIISVNATMQSLSGQFIKTIIYDTQGRGMVLRGIETSISSNNWETLTWNVSDVESYINPLASTTDGYQALIDLGYDPSDPRLQNTQSRITLLTSELSIKLKDFFAIAFEWNNPDLGIVSFINDVKVAVKTSNPDGSSSIVYVDIANFEAFGKDIQDPGEIPLVTFAPEIVNGTAGHPGSRAETTLYLDATDSNDQTSTGKKLIEGTSIQIGQFYSKVYFKETIVPYSEDYESRLQLALSLGYGTNATPPTAIVKIGVTDEETLKNLEKLINNSGTNGIEYYDPYVQLTGSSQFEPSYGDIQAIATERSILISARTLGSKGNEYAAYINNETIDPLTGSPAQAIEGAAFGEFIFTVESNETTFKPTNRLILVNNSIVQQGYMTAMEGGQEAITAGDQTINQPTEEDESAYLENWWTFTKADNFEQPCTRWKEYCPAATISGDSCQRLEIENQTTMIQNLDIPLSKYILTPRCPLDGCDMHHKQVEWYERGWRIGACCGALVEIDGVKWIVVKRSIGIDTSCGGGESEENPCIKESIENGLGHPAIAWPTINGEEFIGRPTSGFARFVKDSELNDKIIAALSLGSAIEYRGNMTFADINDKIPFILFPKS